MVYATTSSPIRSFFLSDELRRKETAAEEDSRKRSANKRESERKGRTAAMATSVQTTLKVDVTESEQTDNRAAPDSPPAARNIRRSLSPLLDFSGRPGSSLGDRRNFCNISECTFCKPLTDNHRLSPLRSPVISPSSRRGIFDAEPQSYRTLFLPKKEY